MHCVMHTLQDARGDLQMVRDQERDKTLERIRPQYQLNEENDQYAPNRGRGYTCCVPRGSSRRNMNEDWEDAWRM